MISQSLETLSLNPYDSYSTSKTNYCLDHSEWNWHETTSVAKSVEIASDKLIQAAIMNILKHNIMDSYDRLLIEVKSRLQGKFQITDELFTATLNSLESKEFIEKRGSDYMYKD